MPGRNKSVSYTHLDVYKRQEQNRIIKLALKQLQDIGYLDHSITKKGKETFILIHRRSANLKPGTAV